MRRLRASHLRRSYCMILKFNSGLTAMMIKRIKPLLAGHGRHKQHWSFLILVDSTLCGMVALCGPCNIIPTYGAVVIGVLASLSFLGIEHLMIKLRIDDPLGSFATHFGGGVVGCIMTPFFMVKEHAGLNGIFFWEGCEEDVAKV
jgi:ammonium transporter, Amt family